MEKQTLKRCNNGVQKKPSFFNLFSSSEFQKVIVCGDCKFTISEEEQCFSDPCPKCGGKFDGFYSFKGVWCKKEKCWKKKSISFTPNTMCLDYI